MWPSIQLIRMLYFYFILFLLDFPSEPGISVFCSAITNGISHLVGHVAVGTLADLVLWKPENFGAKPEMVLKSGVIAWSQVSDCCVADPKRQKYLLISLFLSLHNSTSSLYIGWRCQRLYSNCSTILFETHVGIQTGISSAQFSCFRISIIHFNEHRYKIRIVEASGTCTWV